MHVANLRARDHGEYSLEGCTELAEDVFVPSGYRYVCIFFFPNNAIPYDNIIAGLEVRLVSIWEFLVEYEEG